MKLLYATDLHGDADAYAALASLAQRQAVRAVLLGGDLFAYSQAAAPQIAFAEGPLLRFLEPLRAAKISVLALWGNVDRPAAVARLRDFEEMGLLALLRLQPFRLDGPGGDALDFVGYPYVPPTPFRLKDQERRDLARDRYAGPWPVFLSPIQGDGEPVEVADALDRRLSIEEELATIPTTEASCVLVTHSPPWGCGLDLVAPDEHAGSRAVRAWIDTHQPLLSLHGHLHEAPRLSGRWWERIGDTVCINPGPAFGGASSAVLLETSQLPSSLRRVPLLPDAPGPGCA